MNMNVYMNALMNMYMYMNCIGKFQKKIYKYDKETCLGHMTLSDDPIGPNDYWVKWENLLGEMIVGSNKIRV